MKYLSFFILILTFLGCSCQNSDEPLASDEEYSDSDDSSLDDQDFVTWEDCSHMVGDHPCDFTLKDQNGDDFSLYDNYGSVIVLDFSTMWCYYCKVAASTVQSVQDTYNSQGFLYVTILIEDASGDTVEQDEVTQWADAYGITTAPVLVGDRSMVDVTATTGYPITGWPTMVVINREMVLSHGINGWSEEAIISWIEEELQ